MNRFKADVLKLVNSGALPMGVNFDDANDGYCARWPYFGEHTSIKLKPGFAYLVRTGDDAARRYPSLEDAAQDLRERFGIGGNPPQIIDEAP